MKKVSIRKIEYALPDLLHTNELLAQSNPEWDMDSLVSSTGIQSRRHARPGETACDLGEKAAKKLLSEIEPDSIGAIVCCTVTPDYIAPGNAHVLHGRLKLSTNAAAFNLWDSCPGYVHSLAVAKSLMESFNYRKVILITGDTFSKYCHPNDRNTAAIVGDGVAATLLELGHFDSGILDVACGADGKACEKAIVRAGGMKFPKSKRKPIPRTDLFGNISNDECFQINAGAILSLIRRHVPKCLKGLLDKNQMALSDLNRVFFHQASAATVEILRKQLRLSPEQTVLNFHDIGNTLSASLPIAIKRAVEQDELAHGDLILLVSFGSGFSWGGALVRW